MKRLFKRRTFKEYLFIYTTVAISSFFFLMPLLWLLSSSFKSELEAFADPPIIFPSITLENYIKIFDNSSFLRGMKNSIIVGLGTVFITISFGIPTAFALSRLKGVLKKTVLSWLLIGRVAPGMIYVIPYYLLYINVGLVDTKSGLILINFLFTFPLSVWMMLAFFEDIPNSILDSAQIDGANIFQTITRVVIPMTLPSITSTAILCFIFSWNEFLFALVFARRGARTLPVCITNFMAYEGTDWGQVAAGGIFILLPVVLFSFLIRKYFVKGLISGAVKG